eukprot:m.308321 g.308321  ORF g.308321 m.308321 type:complete len:202 (+) comp43752_c0_seq1:36-641(+)
MKNLFVAVQVLFFSWHVAALSIQETLNCGSECLDLSQQELKGAYFKCRQDVECYGSFLGVPRSKLMSCGLKCGILNAATAASQQATPFSFSFIETSKLAERGRSFLNRNRSEESNPPAAEDTLAALSHLLLDRNGFISCLSDCMDIKVVDVIKMALESRFSWRCWSQQLGPRLHRCLGHCTEKHNFPTSGTLLPDETTDLQ